MSRRKYTTEVFKELAMARHGDKFDYSRAIYKDSTSKITILCKIHGEFSQAPAEHLRGKGCLTCSGLNRSNTQEFSSKAEDTHKGAYDYSHVTYINDYTKVKIVCNSCKTSFMQTPNNHLASHGCPICAAAQSSIRQRSNTEELKKKVLDLHGEKFDLSSVVYGKNSKTKVCVTCKIHGEFFITPSDLLQGRGCPSCATFGFREGLGGFLYVAKSEFLTKVGITNNNAESRLNQVSRQSGQVFKVVKVYGNIPIGHIRAVEKEVLEYLKQVYQSSLDKFNGYTECFYSVNLEELLSRIDKEISNTKFIKET